MLSNRSGGREGREQGREERVAEKSRNNSNSVRVSQHWERQVESEKFYKIILKNETTANLEMILFGFFKASRKFGNENPKSKKVVEQVKVRERFTRTQLPSLPLASLHPFIYLPPSLALFNRPFLLPSCDSPASHSLPKSLFQSLYSLFVYFFTLILISYYSSFTHTHTRENTRTDVNRSRPFVFDKE